MWSGTSFDLFSTVLRISSTLKFSWKICAAAGPNLSKSSVVVSFNEKLQQLHEDVPTSTPHPPPPPHPHPTPQSRKHISWSKVSCCFSTEGILENFDIFLENTSYQTKHLVKIDFMPAIVATGSCCLNLIKTLMIWFAKSGDDKSSLLSTLVSFGTLSCGQILLSFLCQHFLYVANQLIFWSVLFK